MGLEKSDIFNQKENQPLITRADVGKEAPKNRISETVTRGLFALREENSNIAEEYEDIFSAEELASIDLLLNDIGETWVAIALSEDAEKVKNTFRKYLDSGKPREMREEISTLLQ